VTNSTIKNNLIKERGKKMFEELLRFEGRYSRKKFWKNTIVMGIISSVASMFAERTDSLLVALLALAIAIVVLIIIICTAVKRSHDLGKSGIFAILYFIPIVNIYPFILFGFIKGTNGTNDYGQNPLGNIA